MFLKCYVFLSASFETKYINVIQVSQNSQKEFLVALLLDQHLMFANLLDILMFLYTFFES